jgi:hypothetical protein
MVQVNLEFPDKDLWSAVMGSVFETFPWWSRIDYMGDSNWDTPGWVLIGIDDPKSPEHEPKEITKVITVDDLARGMAIAMKEGYRDPFGHTDFPSLDFDSITGDIVMQCAVLGDCVYS